MYNYKIYKHSIRGVCDTPAYTNKVSCEDNTGTWTDAETYIQESWPISFGVQGNIIQNLLLTQDAPAGFVADLSGNEYGFIISASDNS